MHNLSKDPAAITIFVFIGLVITYFLVYIYFKKDYKILKTPLVIVFTFASISIVSSLFISRLYFNYHVDGAFEEQSINNTSEETKYIPIFNSDTLDINYFNLPFHEKILNKGLQNIDGNNILDYYNYYADKIEKTDDQRYKDVAHWALSIIHIYLNETDRAIKELKSISDTTLYKYNFYKGVYYYDINNFKEAERYFSIENKSNYEHSDKFVEMYFYVLLKNKNYAEAKNVLNKYPQQIDSKYITSYYVEDFHPINFVIDQTKLFVQNINWINFSIALFIALTWFSFLYLSDLFQSEKVQYILFVVIIETALLFLCIFIYDYIEYKTGWSLHSMHTIGQKFAYSIGIIAIVEEITKIIPLLLLMVLFKEPDDTYDYLFYAGISALTFSFLENCSYFDSASKYGIYNGRALFSTIGHILDTSIISYGLMYAKYNRSGIYKLKYVFIFFGLGVLSHGLYDFFIFTHLTIFFYLGYFMSIILWVILINNSLNNSKHFTYSFKNNFNKIQILLGISLTIVLLMEYFINSKTLGYKWANSKLLGQLIIYVIIISFFLSRLARYDLIKGHWRKLTFIPPKDSEIVFNKFNILSYFESFFFYNNISPRNYVGFNVDIVEPSPFYSRNSVYKSINTPLHGKIIDRVLVDKNNQEESHWFMLQSKHSIDIDKQFYLFKFAKNFDEISEEHARDIMIYKPNNLESISLPIKNFDDFSFIGAARIIKK